MLPPEVLEQIASHLDTESRLACLQVDRLWNAVFTPSLWHTISGDDKDPWRRLFKPANYPNDEEKEPNDARSFRLQQLQKHGNSIRQISLYDSWSVRLLLQAKVTQLRSLTIYGYHHAEHTKLSASILSELSADVPVHLFDKDYKPSSIALSRACWQLITTNPNLTSIRFMNSTMQSMAPFHIREDSDNSNSNNNRQAGEPPFTPGDYIINVVSSLPKLSHFRLMPCSSEWVLPALASSLLPTIRSYVYSNGNLGGLENLERPSLCTTLESLQILPPIGVRHLRSVLNAFPALKGLEMLECEASRGDPPLPPYNPCYLSSTKGGSIITQSTMIPIVHTALERIRVNEICDLLRAQVAFPNLKIFGPIGEVIDLRQFLLILKSFPVLEHLEVLSLRGQDSLRDSRLPIEKEQPDWKNLKTLILRLNLFRPLNMTRILAKMPHLVRIEIRSLTPDSLVHIGENCRNLEHIRFNLPRPCYKETNQLFIGCPNLRSIQGLGIAVLAEDMIKEKGPRWTCLRLQKFHCEIHGIPRLDPDQEAQLKAKSADPDDSTQQYLIEQHQRSLSVQRQVYQQLARLTNLRCLDVGFPKRRYRQYPPTVVARTPAGARIRWYNTPIPDTLEFSLESGLSELATLHRLDTFGFKAMNHRIGDEELQWMSANWKSLTTVYGLEAHVDGVLCDEKAEAVGKQLKALAPRVHLGVYRHSDSYDS
ncbi:hypothetical protein BGX29_011819 [Mortierella sp. GBA35]|nr:hypothetical protein BGX29_011819 [Mortierella sp. GBA35]